MAYWGDFRAGQMVDIPFPSQGLDGASITLATDGTLRVYKNNSITQRTSLAGVTFVEDFDGVTGWHHIRIDTSNDTDPAFYASGNDFSVGVVGAVVDGKTVNTPIGSWSIENRSALRPTTAGATLDVQPDGSVVATGGLTETGIATAVWVSATRSLSDKLGFELSSAGIIAMWAAAVRELSASGNTAVASAVSAALASSFSALAPSLMADAVWDELLAGHLTAATTGAALNGAGAAGDPWTTPLPGAYGAGTAGKIVGDKIMASVTGAVGSVAGNVSGSVASVVGAVGSVTVVTDKTGYRLSSTGVDDILRTALPEAYAANGATGTLTQLLYMIQQLMTEKAIVTTTMTVNGLDGTTAKATFTLNSATTPTAISRTT